MKNKNKIGLFLMLFVILRAVLLDADTATFITSYVFFIIGYFFLLNFNEKDGE